MALNLDLEEILRSIWMRWDLKVFFPFWYSYERGMRIIPQFLQSRLDLYPILMMKGDNKVLTNEIK